MTVIRYASTPMVDSTVFAQNNMCWPMMAGLVKVLCAYKLTCLIGLPNFSSVMLNSLLMQRKGEMLPDQGTSNLKAPKKILV